MVRPTACIWLLCLSYPPSVCARQAPALRTPPPLPADTSAYEKGPPRFDILLQVRADFPRTGTENSSFFLRKAELGVKGHIGAHTDFSLELDPVRSGDPFRRTYIRLSHLPFLHFKLGLEKAPIGLEELLPTASQPFVDRSAVSDRFAAAEELGVHLESRSTRWLFQFSVTNGGRRLLRDDNEAKDFSGRVVWAPFEWLSAGVATLQGKRGPDSDQWDRYNAELKLGTVSRGFQTEVYRARDVGVWSTAFYAASFWDFALRAGQPVRLQPVARYEQVSRGDNARDEELSLLTMGMSVLFQGHASKLQLNYLVDLRRGFEEDALRVQWQVEF